jgi:hypothetical protein
MTRKRLIAAMLSTFVIVSVAFVLPRGQAAAVSTSSLVTGAGAGVFPAGASFNGIELAGGTYGVGVQTATSGNAIGDVEAQLNGSSVIGLSQWITITGWITTASLNADGTMTFNGTCTLDMGDGTAPVGGLAFIATFGAAGMQLTVGTTVLPFLPRSDGFLSIE